MERVISAGYKTLHQKCEVGPELRFYLTEIVDRAFQEEQTM